MKLLQHAAFKNVGWVLVTKVISMLLFLVTDMMIARALGKTLYGEWAFFYAILTMFFYVYWFGINQSAKVFVSKAEVQDEQAEVIKSSFLVRVGVSIICTLAFFALSGFLATRLGYPDKYPYLLNLLKVGSVIACANSFLEYAKQMNMGVKNFRNFFVCNFLEFFLTFVCVVILFLLPGRGMYSVSNGYLLGNIVAAIISTYLLVKGALKAKTDKKVMKDVFSYAMPLSLLGIGGLLMMEMDTFMLGLMSTKEQIAIYAIAKSLTTKASQVNYSITCGTIQDFAVITKENVCDKWKQFKKVVWSNLICTVAICLFFLLFSKLAIYIIYGTEYEGVVLLIYVLLPYYFLTSVTNLYSNFLDFQNQANIRLISYAGSIVINLVLNWLLIPQYGAFGAAIASGIALVPYGIILFVMSNRVFKRMMRMENGLL